MHERYKGGLQVSKYEKFGFGMMVGACAATAAGMRVLHATGFTATLLEVLGVWAGLAAG